MGFTAIITLERNKIVVYQIHIGKWSRQLYVLSLYRHRELITDNGAFYARKEGYIWPPGKSIYIPVQRDKWSGRLDRHETTWDVCIH
jgi:hypothetical protein